MIKRTPFLFTFLCLPFLIVGQEHQYQQGSHSVYLFGNLVDLSNPDEFFKALDNELQSDPHPFSLVLSGDMVDQMTNQEVLNMQVNNVKKLMSLLKPYAKGKLICIPGDRDWNDSNEEGYRCVNELEDELKAYAKKQGIKNFHWPVKNGCPGPFDLSLDEHVELIAINSQWWNHRFDKPTPADATCKYATYQDINEELNDLIDENRNKNVIIVGHHPIKSLGNYGGRFSFLDHLKPFPIIGSFKRSYQSTVGGVNDLVNERFEPFINLMENAIFLHHNLIYASGHEKNQQIMKMDDNFFINSGAITNPAYAASDFTTHYSAKQSGLMKISYNKSGRVSNTFFLYDGVEKKLQAEHDQVLFTSACSLESIKNPIDRNLTYVPCLLQHHEIDGSNTNNSTGEVSIAAGKQYDKGWLTKLWMGKHYRKDWATPVQTSYLNIDTTFNGLIAQKRGGGRQTFSLRFQSEQGDIYTFRSVDKDPSKALDYKLRETLVSKVFRDQTSAQQPYGALIISSLLDHLDVLHVSPHLYVMPNSSALGPFQEQYGGMLGMLEEHPGKKNFNNEYFGQADYVVKSNGLFRKMFKDKSNIVKTDEFARARIFDIWVGDWSKHEDNWKWAGFDEGENTIFRPIPRDRDMVFSKWDGILPSIADLPFGAPNTESFDMKIKGFKSLVYQARYMDRFLLSQLTKEDYVAQAKYIQQKIDDQNIRDAVSQLPKASFDLSGEEIISKLKQRKIDLVDYAIKYYKWLNHEVEIVGSKDEDIFEIESLNNGDLSIAILSAHEHNNVRHEYYCRIFKTSETKRVRVYGLGDPDKFNFKNDYKSEIELILIGGKGEDIYLLQNQPKNVKVYDLDYSSADSSQDIAFVKHWNKEVYEYDRHRLKFNSWIPSLAIGYNTYQGITLNIGNTWTRQRWDKRDYASQHNIEANISSEGEKGFEYHGHWHEVFKKWDVIADLSLANPEYFNAFYGLGNETTIDDDLDRDEFYLASYAQYIAQLGIAHSFWRKSEVYLKTGIGHFESSPVDGSIFDNDDNLIIGATDNITAIPTKLALDMDLRDHVNFPSKGIRFKVSAENYTQLNGDRNNYGTAKSSIEYYLSNYWKRRVTLGLKLAGAKGFENVPYYHQSNLGGSTGLRAYTGNRFTGKTLVYLNSELRIELINNSDASIPLKIGLLGFYDTGRVFVNDQPQSLKDFKYGYGTGFYIVPFSRSFAMSFILGWSEENTLFPGFTIGTFLN